MMLSRGALKLYPCSADDRSTARCRLPQSCLDGKILVNQWVQIVTEAEVLHCRAWRFATQCLAKGLVAQADRSVRRPSTVAERELLSGLPKDTCLIQQIPDPLSPGTAISFKVSVQTGSLEMEELGFKYDSASDAAKRQAVRGMLLGLVISEGCIVGGEEAGRCLRVERTKIVSVEPPRTRVLVTEATHLRFVSRKAAKMYGGVHAGDEDATAAITDSMRSLSLSPETRPKPSPNLPGLEKAYRGLYEIVTYRLLYPDMIEKLGVDPPKGVLLHGPPGVGKTLLVTMIARVCQASLVTIHGPEIFGSYLGESEERLRAKFMEAQSKSEDGKTPSILFIDELDALSPRRDSARSHENRVVAQLLTLMDGMVSRGRLVVIGATNRPNAIDPALRRPGRFDREVAIDVPTEQARLAILTSLTSNMPLSDDVDLSRLATATNGYVGADLSALCREAALDAVRRSTNDPSFNVVPFASFQKALASIDGPSTQRGAGVSVERVKWDDVGGLDSVKLRLRQAVEWPLLYRKTYKRLGLKPPRGVLLYGPPGCSKTTLVKVIAATSGATFLSLNGAALYSPFVGDSEQAIRTTFQRARSGAPSIIFFDEVDAIVGKRGLGGGEDKGDTVQARVLSTLLNEMDGVESAKDVLIVGATNRPDMIDAALMRPGRFDRVLYVPPPDRRARHEILQIYTRSMALATDVDLDYLSGSLTERYTGADLKAVCREAAMEALRGMREADFVTREHFMAALDVVKPTLSTEMLVQYAIFAKRFGTGVLDNPV
ncbi:hypothetical protein SpCBS45565_g00748 [Spizellomyces sp. 'palustris']|nr:hypothetical protein SpCBS45565_g00748 [Spizellomyces sp. 'palustris']